MEAGVGFLPAAEQENFWEPAEPVKVWCSRETAVFARVQ